VIASFDWDWFHQRIDSILISSTIYRDQYLSHESNISITFCRFISHLPANIFHFVRKSPFGFDFSQFSCLLFHFHPSFPPISMLLLQNVTLKKM
jgi:hypothetical protein